MRRWVFDTENGEGLRFDPRLNLLGFEDWEFFGDLVRCGGVIFQSTAPVSVSRPGIEATPTSAARPYADRRAFAMMEGRNEIATTRIRHGFGAAFVKVARRQAPMLLRGLTGLAGAVVAGISDPEKGRALDEVARLRLVRARAGIVGLWRPGFERPLARRGELREVVP